MAHPPIRQLDAFFAGCDPCADAFIDLCRLLQRHRDRLDVLVPRALLALRDWDPDDCLSHFPEGPAVSLCLAKEWHPRPGSATWPGSLSTSCTHLRVTDQTPSLGRLLGELDLPRLRSLQLDSGDLQPAAVRAIGERVVELSLHAEPSDLLGLLTGFAGLTSLGIHWDDDSGRADLLHWLDRRPPDQPLWLDIPAHWLDHRLSRRLQDLPGLQRLHLSPDCGDGSLPDCWSNSDRFAWVRSPLFGRVASFDLSILDLSEDQNADLLKLPWNSAQLETLFIDYSSQMSAEAFENLARNDTLWKQARFDNKDHGSEELIELLRFGPIQDDVCWFDSELREAVVTLARSPHLAQVQELTLSHMVIGGHLRRALVSSPHLHGLRRLQITGGSGGAPDDWHHATGLTHCQQLEVSGGLDALDVLLSAPHLGAVESLTVHGCALTSGDGDPLPLLQCGRPHPSLRSLHLPGDGARRQAPMDLRILDLLLNGKALPVLGALTLHEQPMAPEQLAQWCAGAPRSSGPLHSLSIGGSQLDRMSVFAAFELAAERGLQHLGLSGTGLDKETLHTMLTRPLEWPALTSLDISNNPLRQRGGKVVRKLLERLPHLKSLDVSATHLSLPDFERIGRALDTVDLQQLHIGGNFINDRKLAMLLTQGPRPGLKTLGLSSRSTEAPADRERLSHGFFRELMQGGLWQQLRGLHLDGVQLDAETWRLWATAPPSSIRALSIDLPSRQTCQQFLALECLPQLEHLSIGQMYWTDPLGLRTVAQCASAHDSTLAHSLLFSGRFPRLQTITLLSEGGSQHSPPRLRVDGLRRRLRWLEPWRCSTPTRAAGSPA